MLYRENVHTSYYFPSILGATLIFLIILFFQVNVNFTRTSIVNTKGYIIKEAISNVQTYTPVQGYLEQSIDEIWNSIVFTVQVLVIIIPSKF